jgi:polyhydroxybutyrate depolymerase
VFATTSRLLSQLVPAAILVVAAACGADAIKEPLQYELGGARPVQIQTPPNIVAGKKYPLVVVLHGYGADGFLQYAYFGVRNWVDRGETFALAPDGLKDSSGKQFWNADPVCCAFGANKPDDSAYIAGLIDEAIALWPIDPAQVYLVGHSNGAFMAYRMACDHADKIAAIAGLAGAASSIPANCKPTQPVSILHMHGTADGSVPFGGGAGGTSSPGAIASVAQWAGKNGCGSTQQAGATRDLDSSVAGAETSTSMTVGCPSTGASDLWTMTGSEHLPTPSPTFSTEIEQWLFAHPREQ